MNNQFKKITTALDDVFILKRFSHNDERGTFTKTYNKSMFEELNIGESLEIKESLCSISKKGVLRGMHFQQHPHGAAKMVSVVKGSILDVIVGIGGKENTRNKGKTLSVELSESNLQSLYIPDGYAHGFLVLSDQAVVVYHQTSLFNADADKGIRFDSFGFEWPVDNPVVSEKDLFLPSFESL